MADYALLKKLSLKNPWHFLALGFGSGLSPKAPGTAGSFVAMFLAMGLIMLPWYYTLIAAIVFFILGTKACAEAEKAMGTHDHGGIVVDEFVGIFISVLFFPQGQWQLAILAFILFRIFDITKPYPVNVADNKIPGGLGVMVDDVIAAIYALLVGHFIIYLFGEYLTI